MNRVAILDKKARERANGFNAAAAERELQLEFLPYTELEHLYRQLEPPALILMHHTWEGLDTSTIINFIASRTEQSRVIVFTGRDLNLPELIQCVRSGVADYWEFGKHDMDFMLQRIVQYCNDSNVTLAKLRMASRPTLQLLDQAGHLEGRIQDLAQTNAKLGHELLDVQSAAHRHDVTERIRTIKVLVYIAAFTASFAGLKIWANIETSAALIFTGIVAAFLLFVDGKLASLVFKWTDGAIDLRVKGNDGPTGGK